MTRNRDAKNFLEDTNAEFKEFLDVSSRGPWESPSVAVTEKIFTRVHRDLNPTPWSVFAKVSFIHLVVGTLTLIFCPQFGFRLFDSGLDLMHIFGLLGAYGCTLACGAFFVGTSLFASGFILRPEELRALKSHRLLHTSALTLISLGVFIMADAPMVIGIAALWVSGSLVGGLLMFETAYRIRGETIRL